MRRYVIAVLALACVGKLAIAASRYGTVKTEVLNDSIAQLNAAKCSPSEGMIIWQMWAALAGCSSK
jgi:hypothetical protein